MKDFRTNRDKEVFSVPPDYFGNLNDRIISNTSERESGRKRTLSLLRPWLSMAAAIAGTAILTVAVVRIATDYPQPTLTAAEMSADIPQFLVDGIDMYLIEYELNTSSQTVIDEQYGEEDIIDYLMVNEVELAMIYDYLLD
ncbi:MAG: hypothetical protein RBS37_11255 [Bacteroidales bacterium]|nr:hypothetical protein [Bacteroidales bacterium]